MKIHFIGIGGIGVSALAKYYLEKGCQITGSDLVSSEITDALKKQGVKISIPHQSKLGTGQVGKHKLPDLVIYSPAVQNDNPELKDGRSLGIKCLSYPEALGELTERYFTIAVSGTHGKSTTTAMIGLILIKAGFDPTIIVGTKVKGFKNSNCRIGKSKFLIIEADEHFASFLNYWPEIIVLTNIEKDHLDYYKNLKNILKAFRKYISHLSNNGVLVANKDDKNIQVMLTSKFQTTNNKQIQNHKFQIRNYSLKQKEAKKLKKILKIPGEHNIYNALAALTAARALKVPDRISFKVLSEYKGSWRRFEEKNLKIGNCKLKIISDYGHHPTEIRATLKAAREKWSKRKIWCVYQPHQYQRTYYLFNDFVKVFKKAPVDKLIITDIYDVAGREENEIKRKISPEKLIKTIKKPWVIYLKKDEILDHLKKNLKDGEVVIIMGAGNIYKINDNLNVLPV